jgi:hypothetical protein
MTLFFFIFSASSSFFLFFTSFFFPLSLSSSFYTMPRFIVYYCYFRLFFPFFPYSFVFFLWTLFFSVIKYLFPSSVTWLAQLSVSRSERINSALFFIPPSFLPLSTLPFFVYHYLFLFIPYYFLVLVTSPCFLHYEFLRDRIKEKRNLLWSSDLLSTVLHFNVNWI